jgi:hypothetical protein
MGRGLSPLQRHILTEAGKRQRVYYAEVLVSYFGWEPKKSRRWREDGTLECPGYQHFSPAEIGRSAYRSALATLSRTCARLGDRGLVTCLWGKVSHWAGVEITEKGKEWLSVNSAIT